LHRSNSRNDILVIGQVNEDLPVGELALV